MAKLREIAKNKSDFFISSRAQHALCQRGENAE
jgi:hypothetical protein